MVVGIYSVPDAISPKRRCSEGSSSLLPCGRPFKRWKADNAEEAEVILEAPESAEPPSSLVLLEDNRGIWPVDGLLELLVGALCATFGADPLEMTCAADGASSSCITEAVPLQSRIASSTQQSQQLDCRGLATQLHPLQLQPQRPAPATAKLTEVNLRAHTASSQSATSSRQPSLDDEDRSSVASLSAWVAGTQSPKRRGSEAGSQLGCLGGASATATSSAAAAAAFSFTPRWTYGGANGCGGGGDGSTQAGIIETRWPRRRPSAFFASTRW